MALIRYRGKLSTLFPPDEESSHWMVRLTMIRHDLRYEVSQLGLTESSTPDEVFRTTYFLRRLSISVLEAENVLTHDLGKLLKRGRNEIPSDLARALTALRSTVSAARPTIEGVRNVIGGHLRPKSDDTGKPTVTQEVLRTHNGWEVDVAIDPETGENTDMRDVAMASFLFAWPDVKTDEDLDRRHGEYQNAMFAAVSSITHATDLLLFAYWSDLGITTTEEDASP